MTVTSPTLQSGARFCLAVGAAATFVALCSVPARAQLPQAVASVSKDSVALAEVFELRIEIPVPPGRVVFFPDTVPATDYVESSSTVEWTARGGANGGATLELTYPLMPFGTADVQLPPVDIVIVPLDDQAAANGERIPGGSRVGEWVDAPRSIRYTRRVTGSTVWVEPLYGTEDLTAGLSPRPPDDVVGFSWSLSAAALLLLFSTVIGGAVVTTTRSWLAERAEFVPTAPSGPASLSEAKTRAVAQLDQLLAAGPHRSEETLKLYGTSSGIVRNYAEQLHTPWGPELTSSELMDELGAHALAGEELFSEMGAAEAVKFGGLRPDAKAADAHLRALRAWMAQAPEASS